MDKKIFRELVKEAARNVKKSELESFTPFIKSFYIDLFPEELVTQNIPSLYFRAHQSWKYGRHKKADTSLVRVFNPNTTTHGYGSVHTVIEIVTDDMPFIINSIIAYLSTEKLKIFLLIHPIFSVHRKKSGEISKVIPPGGDLSINKKESFIHIEITRQPKPNLVKIREKIELILAQIRQCNDDRQSIRNRIVDMVNDIHPLPKGFNVDEVSEVQEFVDWLNDGNFIFLGFREYKKSKKNKSPYLKMERSSGLGLLRDSNLLVFDDFGQTGGDLPEVRAFMKFRDIILVTKTNRRSDIFRSVHMDAIGIKKFDDEGKVIGHRLFVGLFTPAAYNRPPNLVPLLRRRIQAVMEKSGFSKSSHNGVSLRNILDTYPRDELFQINNEVLLTTALGILRLEEQPRTAIFIRKDELEQFFSCLVYVPREVYTTEIRERIQTILSEELGGTIAAFYTQLDDKPLARCQIIVRAIARNITKLKHKKIEDRLISETRPWKEGVYLRLANLHGEEAASNLSDQWLDQFERAYQDLYKAPQVVEDIEIIESVLVTNRIGLNLYRDDKSFPETSRFKIYSAGGIIALSDVLPIFEQMGFQVIDEKGPLKIRTKGGGDKTITIHDFGLRTKDGLPFALKKVRENFHNLFLQVWENNSESDGFNALTVKANLNTRSITIIRAYSKFLKQIGITFSQAYMEQTLVKNPKISSSIISLFFERFDPTLAPSSLKRIHRLRSQIKNLMAAVTSADEDRILRRFWNLVETTTRTNFFQKAPDDTFKPYVSFKFNSQAIEDLPLPRPFREIFVYSPKMEGLHLRFGYIARGGLRWSDRPEDFRTEVLGLVKAQQVKNSVIVPVGSKGGFVSKSPPSSNDRATLLAEGIECYKTLISGMLDVTDNFKATKIIPPNNVIRKDDNDPYLVVAADKGTATFSDIANEVSLKYGHWLGDAFASGGSQGYDHKKMGITAKGAWESVKLHFREMGKNIQNEDFTVIGIGDMAGDVFGNGMLLSKHTKLIAAFNHMHIFIDPSPDPKKSWEERKRLFDKAGSTWADYNPKTLSPGGAIFDRQAKVLTLTKEIKTLLRISKPSITPKELIRIIIGSKVELLWFGGIGTYVKSSTESHIDVGDKTNDSIRVNASELQCEVVGEGANLGLTQLGRIEFSINGGRINTDAIDNSAGVDSSDHEVNIKILLSSAIEKGLLNEQERNKLLAKMTNEVADLVLVHNYRQCQAITQIESEGLYALDNQQRLMKMLERQNDLDRKVEFLPDDDTISERRSFKQGLYRPEISVLLSYAKIWLYNQLVKSSTPDDPYLVQDLVGYFPKPLRKAFNSEIKTHRLRREIIATRVSNALVDRVGETFVSSFIEKTGFNASEISKAYIITVEVFELTKLWSEVELLDNSVPSRTQVEIRSDINMLVKWVVLWLLRNRKSDLDLYYNIKTFKTGITVLSSNLEKTLPIHYQKDTLNRARTYIDNGVPKTISLRISSLVNLYFGCDIVSLAAKRKMDVLKVAKAYFAIGTRFKLGRLREAANNLNSENHWTQLATSTLIEEIYSHQLALTNQLLKTKKGEFDANKTIEEWVEKNERVVEPTERLLKELWSGEVNDLSMISVASRQIRSMVKKD